MESNNISKESDYNFSLAEENIALKSTLNYIKLELDRLKNPPLVVCDLLAVYNDKALIRLANNNKFFVNIIGDIKNKIKPGDKVLAEQKSLCIVDKLSHNKKLNLENFVIIEKPKTSWRDIGGLKNQIMEIKEVIELPLKKPELFEKIGIIPPKGILLYGSSGTGKTELAKAVAYSTNATFIHVVGSEFVQKFIGEGSKLVKELFKLAREKAPTIIFIDELDAIATERVDIGSSGEREVHRTFMQLLSEIDGFNNLDNVKIIAATNRVDILDSAILRPGRLDRLIEIPLPDLFARKEIFKIHSKNMNLDNIDFDELIKMTEGFSGADIRSVCTEAGYFAIRDNRYNITFQDFLSAIKKIIQEIDSDHLKMFG